MPLEDLAERWPGIWELPDGCSAKNTPDGNVVVEDASGATRTFVDAEAFTRDDGPIVITRPLTENEILQQFLDPRCTFEDLQIELCDTRRLAMFGREQYNERGQLIEAVMRHRFGPLIRMRGGTGRSSCAAPRRVRRRSGSRRVARGSPRRAEDPHHQLVLDRHGAA